MPRLSVSLETVSKALLEAEEQAAKLVSRLSRAQADWRPKAHSWSVRQCLDHLARTNLTYAGALQEAISSSRKPRERTVELTPGWFGAWFVKKMEPPVQTKFKTFQKVVPAETGNIQDALAAFVKSHEPVRRVLEAAANVDFNRVRFRNPFVVIFRFSVGTGLLIINAHDRRHLWQAQRIVEMPGISSPEAGSPQNV
jgi:hypothetical protein